MLTKSRKTLTTGETPISTFLFNNLRTSVSTYDSMIRLLSYFLIIAVLLSGCNIEKPAKIRLSGANVIKEAEITIIPKGAIRIGIAAIISPREGYLYYKELLDYIGRTLSRPVIIKQGHYREINNLLNNGGLDIAFTCSGPYVNARREFDARLLAVPIVDGRNTYNAYIIVNRSSKISSFSQLKGKRFAFTEYLSTTGYLYPMSLLKRKDATPNQFFSKYIFTLSHDNSILAVANNIVDGASVHSLIWDYLSKTDPSLTGKTKIISTSPEFGNPPVITTNRTNPELISELEKIFLELHDKKQGRAILSKLSIDSFSKADDSLYDSVSEMLSVTLNKK